MKIRFQLLPTAFLVAFVIALTAITYMVAMAKFESLANESARTVFSLIAQRNADQLRTMLSAADTVVQGQALREPHQILLDGQVNQAGMTPALIATLRANPHLYSVFYGFNNGAFLQVIGVRDNTNIASTLQAPAGTYFAVRTIGPSGKQEHWQFLASNERPIGSTVNKTTYIPSSRPWYDSALANPGLHITEPYIYEPLHILGLTLSQALVDGTGVFGADLTLGDLESYAAASLEGREGGIIVTDDHGNILAAHTTPRFDAAQSQSLQPAAQSANPLYAEAASMLGRDTSRISPVQGEDFVYTSRSISITPTTALHVVAFAPMSLYTGTIDKARNDIALFAALVLVIFLPLTHFVGRRISGPLEALTADAERIQRLDFSGERPVRSMFQEIDLLGKAQHTMKMAIRERTEALDQALERAANLLESGMQLASRRSQDTVMHQTLDLAQRLVNAQTGQFWLCTTRGSLRLAASSRRGSMHAPPPKLEVSLADDPTDPCVWAITHNQPLMLNQASHAFDIGTQRTLLGTDPQSLLVVPVVSRGEKNIGVLVLANADDRNTSAAAFDPDLLRYAETLAVQSGCALENLELLVSQRTLMDSILQLIAAAIDAKSAHTGSHCARVPELARMLAKAACDVEQGPLAEFRFETEDQWREFRIGTWLHDCGKITTPEYVVDKATKLETISNRIHEIRTRFEVLLRDAEIGHLNTVLAGGDPIASQQSLDAARAQLQDDFSFVAACNIGGESMLAEHIDRLNVIARKPWLRHFDNRLGISQSEQNRFQDRPAEPLPAVEQLLADKPEHIVPRTNEHRYDERHGFRMVVPEHLYNFGELYNLSIPYGTLTAEERYKINEHIVQTVVMLDQLPLPSDLQRVPEYASTHHETLKGTGYPRMLGADELSIPARIMAIADIFEALTASDRPYKKAKPLSEAVRILASFKAKGHIDSDLFDLFLTSGVYRRYAETYLPPEQIDQVDVMAYVDA